MIVIFGNIISSHVDTGTVRQTNIFNQKVPELDCKIHEKPSRIQKGREPYVNSIHEMNKESIPIAYQYCSVRPPMTQISRNFWRQAR